MTQMSPNNRPDCEDILRGKSLWTLEEDDIKGKNRQTKSYTE
jgi:hypothetical protein